MGVLDLFPTLPFTMTLHFTRKQTMTTQNQPLTKTVMKFRAIVISNGGWSPLKDQSLSIISDADYALSERNAIDIGDVVPMVELQLSDMTMPHHTNSDEEQI